MIGLPPIQGNSATDPEIEVFREFFYSVYPSLRDQREEDRKR